MDDVRVIEQVSLDDIRLMPGTIALMVFAIIWLLKAPRDRMMLPILLIASFVQYGQNIHLGIAFYMLRIIVLVGLVRAVSQGMLRSLQLNQFDRLYLLWAAVTCFIGFVSGRESITSSVSFMLDYVAEYLLIRCAITGPEALKSMVRMLVFLAVIVAIGMLIERKTQKDYFYFFGADINDVERDGETRATAAFPHPILAGTFGAIVFPLAFLFRNGTGRDKAVWIAGMISGALIVVCSKSSGPLYGLISGAFAIALWPIRQHVRTLRNALWALLVVLQFVMNGPVYSLIFKIPDALHLVSGSTSFHRYELINLSVVHFWEWCFTGITIDDVAKWEWGIQDITNQYLFFAFAGGIFGLVLFIMILVRCFSMVGRCVHHPALDADQKWRAWVIGSLMFAQVMCFFGVSYFSGFWFFLELSYAIVASCCDPDRAVLEAAPINRIPVAEPMPA